MIKLFYPKDFFDSSIRFEWIELLRSKNRLERGDGTEEDRKLHNEITWIDDISEADMLVIPMDWGYYYNTKTKQPILEWANAWKNKLPVISQSRSDHVIKIPEGIWQFRNNIYASKAGKYYIPCPPFFQDPVDKIFSHKEITVNPYEHLPSVGFCGQSTSSPFKIITDISRVILLNILSDIHLNHFEKHKIMSAAYLRDKTLDIIERSSLQTNFIRREKYRAGAKTEKQKEEVTREYFLNQQVSNYIVCVRGGGNYSVRFFETLAMGRIPVFVNTDCKLPLSNSIEWNKHVVWVEHDELKEIPEKILAFHEKLGEDGFRALQQHNRKLWETNLTLSSFYPQALKEILAKS